MQLIFELPFCSAVLKVYMWCHYSDVHDLLKTCLVPITYVAHCTLALPHVKTGDFLGSLLWQTCSLTSGRITIEIIVFIYKWMVQEKGSPWRKGRPHSLITTCPHQCSLPCAINDAFLSTWPKCLLLTHDSGHLLYIASIYKWRYFHIHVGSQHEQGNL